MELPPPVIPAEEPEFSLVIMLDGWPSAIVRDGVSAAAVVFAPEYGSEDDHQIRSHICSRDCAGSTSPDRLAPEA